MSNEFNLIDLIPQPLHFRDVATCEACDGAGCEVCAMRGRVLGQRYDARTAAMFGPIDLATQQRLQREMVEATQIMQRAGASDAELESASATLESVLDDFMLLIVPGLPVERVAAIESGYKLQFITWWRQQHPEPTEGKAQARPVTRGRPSRASSTPATTPRAS